MRTKRAVLVTRNHNLARANEEQRWEIERLKAQIAGYQDELLKAKERAR
jgi:hypothetical protein